MTNPPPALTSDWSLQPTMDWLFTKGRMIGSPLQVILEEHRSLHQPLGDLPEDPHAAYAELIAGN